MASGAPTDGAAGVLSSSPSSMPPLPRQPALPTSSGTLATMSPSNTVQSLLDILVANVTSAASSLTSVAEKSQQSGDDNTWVTPEGFVGEKGGVVAGSGGSDNINNGGSGGLYTIAKAVVEDLLTTTEEPLINNEVNNVVKDSVVRYKETIAAEQNTALEGLVEAVGLGASGGGSGGTPRLLSVLSLHQDTTEGSATWLLNNSTSYLPLDVTDLLSSNNATAVPPVTAGALEIVLISIVVIFLSVLTAGGNLMVLVSFRMDKQLQTVSNYFLLSLAVADFFIGIISMPLYTVYLLMKRWPLGPLICDTWLSIDYTMSNASVANLLLISFDRYLSVTRPLTYRAKRTPRRAAIMISLAWVISAIVWTPWIFAWPYIEGERTVEENECYIQFLATNQYLTVITAVAAFYLPVLLMCVLYFKIYLATERRQKDLGRLQATKQISKYGDSSDDDVCTSLSQKRGDSSPDLEEAVDLNHELAAGPATGGGSVRTRGPPKRSCWKCNCCRIDRETIEYADDSSSSDPPGSPVYECTPSASQQVIAIRRDHSLHEKLQNGKHHNRRSSGSGLMIPLIAVDSNRSTPTATPSTDITTTMSRHSQLSSATAMTSQSADDSESGFGTPCSSQPPQPLISEVTQKNDPVTGGTTTRKPPLHHHPIARRTSSQERHHARMKERSSDMYTILIKLPDEGSGDNAKPTIKMITDSETDDDSDPRYATQHEAEKIPMTEKCHNRDRHNSNNDNNGTSPQQDGRVAIPTTPTSTLGRRLSNQADLRMAMQARVAAKLVNKAKSQRARKKRQERKEENKAAKTLSAILLAFIVTWTPYNIFTVIKTFCQDECINNTLYAIGYWLCYINSTINPICYALCNANFRRTYWRILTCRFGKKNKAREAQKRSGIYETSTSGMIGKANILKPQNR